VLSAGTYRQLTEVIPNAVAGAAGLLMLVLELPVRLQLQSWSGPLAAAVIGLGILAAAFARSVGDDQRTRGPHAIIVAAVLLLRAVSVVLMIGSFGVFTALQSLGHRL
jgi:hypothetical protein